MKHPAIDQLQGTHDLKGLPKWGPYTKKYIGVSHIADEDQGIRFDLSLFPGFYRRKVDIPNVTWESGYHPWKATTDLSAFTYRHELEWKDQVYSDISYEALDEHSRLLTCHWVNNTQSEQNVVLHYMASLQYPQIQGHGARLEQVNVDIPSKAVWLDALDYENYIYATPNPMDHLGWDGFYRGEVRSQHSVNGSALSMGRNIGDLLSYHFNIQHAMQNAIIMIRYLLPKDESLTIQYSSDGLEETVTFIGTGRYETKIISLGQLEASTYRIALTTITSAEFNKQLQLDGLVIVEQEELADVTFVPISQNMHPEVLEGPVPNSVLLKYEGLDQYYGMVWEAERFETREFHTDQLDAFMRHNVHHHIHSTFKGSGDGHYTNVFIRPISLHPQSELTMYGMVCEGSKEFVEQKLSTFESSTIHSSVQENDIVQTNSDGQPYLLSQQLMQATLATNVVYPVYTKRSYIRHYTPGRWWDSLYTWDSGFIGIGLAELDHVRAIECLNAYVTDVGDSQHAFIHHGSMVPVQHYLFLEIWNKTQSQEVLHYFYPRLKQYYLFYSGQIGRSTTNVLHSNLLKTWDYFYNSGGWDDYPPQAHVHRQSLQPTITPVSNTAHAIRIAKILKMAAVAIGGLEKDVDGYDKDIEKFSKAIQQHAWDEDSGYFGYVVHNHAGEPSHILKHESGQNFNMGLDGAYPFIADICSPEQEQSIVKKLMSEEHLWTQIGITAVDQSAAYYRADGYWNGAVWMPHQWFYFKALLGAGYHKYAYQIAQTALNLWKKEVENSYNCFEHFVVQSGRGAGWHQFGGLSSPVINWFAAYYKPGTITAGYDVWLENVQWNEEKTEVIANLQYFGSPDHRHTILVCLKENIKYEVRWNGSEITYEKENSGTLALTLDAAISGELVIKAKHS